MKTVKKKKSGTLKTIHKFVENLEKQRSCHIKQNLIENLSQSKRSEVFHEIGSKKIKSSEFSKNERIKTTPAMTVNTNKEKGQYDRLLNFIESLEEDSMPNATLQSQDESTKNSTVAIEKVFGSGMNNKIIKKYFQVAKDTKCFKKCTTQQNIRSDLKSDFSNKENIEGNYFLSYKNDIVNTTSVFENIQVASKRMNLNKNESITKSLNIIEESSKKEDMETSVLDVSKRNSIYNFVIDLDQNGKTENTINQQNDTFIMEEHNTKDLWKKISIKEFTDKVLQETNDKAESKSAVDTLSNSVSLENPKVTVNSKLYELKANNEKCNKDVGIFSNLSLKYNRNDKMKEFHFDNCMKELSDFSNVQAEHNKQQVKENRMANEAQYFKLEPVETNELEVKPKSGEGETSKLEDFETIPQKTSSSLITHNKRKINYCPKYRSKENNYFDNLRETSESWQGLVSSDIDPDNKNSIPIKNYSQLTESSDINCINSNNVYLSDILSKENNLLEVGGIINQKCTEKSEYASQDAIECTTIDNQKNINSSHNDYIAQTNNNITENLRNLDSSHHGYIAQTDRSLNYSKASDLLDDELLKSILMKNYESHKRKPRKECRNMKNVFTELTQDFQIDMDTNEINSNKCQIQRFRKGKVKIYRLKKLKKINSMKKESQEVNLNFDELFQKITQHFVEPKSSPASLDSCYSVSTPSSYISDDARSETLSTGSKNLNSPDRLLRQGLNELSKDQNLLYCDSQYKETTDYSKDEIKMRIQDIFLQVFDDLTNGRRCLLRYRRQCYENCELKNDRLQFRPNEWVTMSEISSSSKRSEAKFKLIIFILEKIHTLLETNTKLTKRLTHTFPTTWLFLEPNGLGYILRRLSASTSPGSQ